MRAAASAPKTARVQCIRKVSFSYRDYGLSRIEELHLDLVAITLPEGSKGSSRLPPSMRRFAVLALVVPLLAAGCGGRRGLVRAARRGPPLPARGRPLRRRDRYELRRGPVPRRARDRRPLPARGPGREGARGDVRARRPGGLRARRQAAARQPVRGRRGRRRELRRRRLRARSRSRTRASSRTWSTRPAGTRRGEGGARSSTRTAAKTPTPKDDVLVVVKLAQAARGRLARRGGGDTLTEERFDSALGDLPRESLVRLYLDLEAPIGEAATAGRRRGSRWGRSARLGWWRRQGATRWCSRSGCGRTPDWLTHEDPPVRQWRRLTSGRPAGRRRRGRARRRADREVLARRDCRVAGDPPWRWPSGSSRASPTSTSRTTSCGSCAATPPSWPRLRQVRRQGRAPRPRRVREDARRWRRPCRG